MERKTFRIDSARSNINGISYNDVNENMDVSVTLPDDVYAVLAKYAERKGISVSQALVSSFISQLEDEVDAEYCDRIMDSYTETRKSIPLADVMREYGLK